MVLYTATILELLAAAEIKPTETVMIEECECLIDYTKKAIYLVEAFIGYYNWNRLAKKNVENE